MEVDASVSDVLRKPACIWAMAIDGRGQSRLA